MGENGHFLPGQDNVQFDIFDASCHSCSGCGERVGVLQVSVYTDLNCTAIEFITIDTVCPYCHMRHTSIHNAFASFPRPKDDAMREGQEEIPF